MSNRDFPGGPVAGTLSAPCRGPRFDPWSGNQIPRAATKSLYTAIKKKKKIPCATTKTSAAKLIDQFKFFYLKMTNIKIYKAAWANLF